MLDAPVIAKARNTHDNAAFHVAPAWFDCWRSAYLDAGSRAMVIGGLPMLSERAALGPLGYRRLHSQTNNQTPAFDVADPDALDRAFNRPDWMVAHDVAVIDYVPETSPILTAVERWPAGRRAIRARARVPVADCRSSYADWLARRSKRNRQRWRAPDQTLARKLGMQLAFVDDSDDLPVLLDEMLALEQAGWKGRGQSAIVDDQQDVAFYRMLAQRAAAAGTLRLALLRKDSRLVAFEFAVLSGARLLCLKIAYDEAYAAFSIGQLLAAAHIQKCCSDPAIDWYDELGNGMTLSDHKLRRADVIETLYRVTLYGGGWRARLIQQWDNARAGYRHVRRAWAHRRRRAA